MENLLRHVDLYCERTGPEYWAEPLNALSNLAFIAAGLWFLVKFRREGRDGGLTDSEVQGDGRVHAVSSGRVMVTVVPRPTVLSTRMVPPFGVYFTALLRMLSMS